MNQIYAVILVYFLITFLIVRYFSRKESLQEYFLNNKSSGLRLLIFSNVATLIGAGAVLSAVSAIYDTGISFGITNIISFLFGAIILGVIAKKIAEAGTKYQIYSIVDFFKKRFDRKNEILVLIVQLLLLIIRTTAQIVGITYLINALTGINYYVALGISAGITVLYTAIGGLKIDLITDFLQFWIILIVFIIMAFFGYQHVGSISNLISNLPAGHLNIFNFWGIGFFIGAIVFGGLIYIPNTTHRQRILSAKSKIIASKSFYRSLPFLVFLMGIVIFLGLVASVLLKWINPNTAIFALIQEIMPNKRLIWVWFACILAVIMSSVDSLLVWWSTIIYKNIVPNKNFTEKKWILYARLLTLWFGAICMMIAIVIPDIVTLSLLCSYLALIFVPAVIAGFYAPKVSANASFYSILIPAIILLSLYFVIGKNTFIISTLLSIIIIICYDRVFKKNKIA
ncbi:MAG: hypothetical protein ACD_80C00129G0006 [uncultured bacterium (gcode 4)]|uniref:Sodium:solute symporter family protein n=1 Tax=uncultured bacterium (gcode 4) TaxID=1234023 RepID=K1XIL0_9BACT|nr:MAG: hypothetical protein ACD_80C00129G0006 [uncultured bacterium (gcode 4)]